MTTAATGSIAPDTTQTTRVPDARFLRNTAGTLTFNGSADELVAELRPADPVHIFRAERFEQAAQEFLTGFSGKPMYAVKCNPDKAVIQTLYRSGIRAFDVASIGEVRLVRKLAPKATLYFMHPIKSREAIFEAYFTHGVRRFVLDTQEELFKILQETRLASDLELFVRIAVNNTHAALSLSGKFGCGPEEAAELLKACRPVCTKLGVSFHVGSQCMNPVAYREAIAQAASVVESSGVKLDVIDVGGGFPVAYEGMTPPPLTDYFTEIDRAIADFGLQGAELLAEPGRALVGRGMSLIARVELRKNHKDGTHTLHLNDGTYGGLQEGAKWQGIRYPVRQAGRKRDAVQDVLPFRLAGPTCDSLDMMPGPYLLPADIGEGDWIEIEQHGAYGLCTRSSFNGFSKFEKIFLKKTQ